VRKHYSPERRDSEPGSERVEASVSEKRQKHRREALGDAEPATYTGGQHSCGNRRADGSGASRIGGAFASQGKASVPREIA
jgi:hypothetical protein